MNMFGKLSILCSVASLSPRLFHCVLCCGLAHCPGITQSLNCHTSRTSCHLELAFFKEAIVSGVYLLVKCGHARRHIHLLCVGLYIYISQNEPPCFNGVPAFLGWMYTPTSRYVRAGYSTRRLVNSNLASFFVAHLQIMMTDLLPQPRQQQVEPASWVSKITKRSILSKTQMRDTG